MKFPQPTQDDVQTVYLEETDKPLPETLNPKTRYAFFSTMVQGGKSIIQSCRDLHLGRVICHKSLRKEFWDDEIEQQRLLREARVTATLQHPNTVPVYELGRDNRGGLYFTMKLVHGHTLREVFAYRDRYDLVQLVEVLIQVGQALDYAHNHGVAHRDLKPENILVGPFGEVLLLDWGLAKVWGRDGISEDPPEHATSMLDAPDTSLTGQGALQGTVAYMSPEQIRRDPKIDARTDIYSLGAVLYELISGELPSPGKTVGDVLANVRDLDVIRPSQRSKLRIPPQLESICMTCLRKDPGARYRDMAELVRLLQGGWSA